MVGRAKTGVVRVAMIQLLKDRICLNNMPVLNNIHANYELEIIISLIIRITDIPEVPPTASGSGVTAEVKVSSQSSHENLSVIGRYSI